MKKGLIHVYCGDGKGKTTASLGLAMRAAGSGMKVVILQFLKGRYVSELESIKLIPGITLIRNQKDFGFLWNMSEEEKAEMTALHNENLLKALELVKENQCDLLILDEIIAAYANEVVDKEIIDELVLHKKPELELVLTGRNPARIFLDSADYVTEMKKIKHPYDENIPARKGIEL